MVANYVDRGSGRKCAFMDRTTKLCEIIYRFDSIGYNKAADDVQEQARLALAELFATMRKCNPDRKFHSVDTGHFTFMRNFLPICEALEKRDYCWACHELLTLFHYEPVFQRRIFYPLLWLLSKYIGGEKDASLVGKK